MDKKMTKQETFDYIEELEDNVKELNEELRGRPERLVIQVNEITIENSAIAETGMGEFFQALSNAQGEFRATHKGSSGHGYDYADLDAVLSNSSPITSKFGISIVQMNVSKMLGKTPLVGVKTIVGHEGGGWISGEVYMPTMKTKMNSLVQMAGVNITYLRRYGVQSALGLATTDNDGRDD